MNIDIHNIGYYRVTSHGGRSYQLFNRRDDLVYDISAEDYAFIMILKTVSRCETIELQQLAKVKVAI